MPHLFVNPRGARFMGRHFPCAFGRGGLTEDKREGDGATPLGTHGLVGLLYRPDRIAQSALPDWARPIGAFDRWSDDPRDVEYNHYLPDGP
ncbi:MAG: L,D-transpeptidase family protein, partial [Pseudomonadota bacterium]